MSGGLNFGQSLFPNKERTLINYDYLDVESGMGVVNFYGVKAPTSTATYHLVEDNSMPAGTQGEGANLGSQLFSGATINAGGTKTFDTQEFIINKTIKGIAYASIPISAYVESGSGSNSDVTLTNVKLVHVHSAGTTALTNEFDFPLMFQYDAGPVINNASVFVAFNSITSTKIAIGDKIRLSFDITGTNKWAIYHNPSGSSVTVSAGCTATHTRLMVSLPFKLNID